jgi:flagellar motor protein MotB
MKAPPAAVTLWQMSRAHQANVTKTYSYFTKQQSATSNLVPANKDVSSEEPTNIQPLQQATYMQYDKRQTAVAAVHPQLLDGSPRTLIG